MFGTRHGSGGGTGSGAPVTTLTVEAGSRSRHRPRMRDGTWSTMTRFGAGIDGSPPSAVRSPVNPAVGPGSVGITHQGAEQVGNGDARGRSLRIGRLDRDDDA